MQEYVEDYFPAFLFALHHLPAEEQELLLGYLVLGKTQQQLATAAATTQTVCSSRIRRSLFKLTLFTEDSPDLDSVLREVFVEACLENRLAAPLSEIVAVYGELRSWADTARELDLTPRSVQFILPRAANLLTESKEPRHKAVGAWLKDFIRKPTPRPTEYRAKTPSILGQFRIDIASDHFDQVFTARANLEKDFVAPRINQSE